MNQQDRVAIVAAILLGRSAVPDRDPRDEQKTIDAAVRLARKLIDTAGRVPAVHPARGRSVVHLSERVPPDSPPAA